MECALTAVLTCSVRYTDVEVLLYPISLLTGAAVSEGIVEVLSRRMKATGTDARGRGVGKRDAKSLRKLSMKLSCDIRLDIQDVLEIPTVSDIRASGLRLR